MQTLYNALMHTRPAILASGLKKLLRIQRSPVTTPYGTFWIDPVSNFGRAIRTHRRYEPDMMATVTQLLQDGDTFLDIGGNEGYFSILAAQQVGASGRVICVEPQSRLQPVLSRNVAENAATVEILQAAIADQVGTATLSLSPDINTGSSGLFRTTAYATPVEQVPQTTLAQLFSDLHLSRIKLMKVDVEGFEYEVVMGGQAILEQGCIEHIALELHPSILQQRGRSESKIVATLNHCGYRVNPDYPTLVFTKH